MALSYVTAIYDQQKDPWYSPIETVKKFQVFGNVFGSNLNKREFKTAREMFTAAITLLGAYELNPENKYWLQVNKQSPSPDIMAARLIVQPGKLNIMEIAQMEIVTFEDHFPSDDIVEFLKATKLSRRKSYDANTIIVCNVNRKVPVNHREMFEKLKVLNPKSTIYVTGRSNDVDSGNFIIFSPFPKLTKVIEYNVFKTAEKYSLPFRIRFHLGANQKNIFGKDTKEYVSLYNMFGLDEKKIKEQYKELLSRKPTKKT